MAHFLPSGFGWLPCAPDYRDFTAESPASAELLRSLAAPSADQAAEPGASPSSEPGTSVDLREYFLEVDDQQSMPTSSAHACLALVQYFERRAHGKILRPSRLFLHQNALRWAHSAAAAGVDLRTTLQAMIHCGVPEQRHWPYEPARLAEQPDAFLYTFGRPYKQIRYLRLDGRQTSGRETLAKLKAFLAAGFPACFGCQIPDSLTADGLIPYRPTFDAPLGGQALVAVGYDDRWLRGSRGALLVRSSWGTAWGEQGYGWLPYAFVEERLAIDFFTLLHPAWMASGEFDAPI